MIQRLACLGWLLGFIMLSACDTPSLEIYVSPVGNDAAAGTLSAPVLSLQRAAQLARENSGQVPVTIFLSGGRYPLTTSLVLGPDDGGTAEAPVQWKAMPGENPIISGGIPVDNWSQEEDGSWSASLPSDYQGTFRSFYVNGKRATRARFPDEGYLRIGKAGGDKRTNFYFNDNDIPEIAEPERLELIFLHDWSVTRIPVKSIDWNARQLTAVDSIGSRLAFFTLTNWEEQPRYYLENAQEFCDQPGEWYADFENRKVYYRPAPGDRIEESTGIIPLAEKLIVIEGDEEQHVAYISFTGITFEHSAWQVPEHGYCGVQACMFSDRGADQSGWSKIPAAIELDLADHCSFVQCTIRNTGGSGIWIQKNCSGCEISQSHIHSISGNGVSIGEGQDRLADGVPWWISHPEEASTGNKVSQSLIERCGLQFHGAVGIWCGLVANTTIEHNEIRDLPYTGVSVGWMWTADPTPCRENTLNANHIHHIMTILSDGGGIYSLGLQPGSRITNNLIHDVQVNAGRAESNGMFLDEGTKELLIENNIVYDIAKSPLRFHKAFHPTMVSNNVLVCKDDTPPIAYNSTKEDDIQKVENIILSQSSESDMLRLEELLKNRFP
ncbi:MAG: right-handed parallel beta-helix repeat-containing protein [Bacteroidia bacterium]|nr:MAG: right-handed parallel beta-helix repeat-containing protein [Bacteroidia bacterium]